MAVRPPLMGPYEHCRAHRWTSNQRIRQVANTLTMGLIRH